MARGWPLTGRRDELRLIETALRRSGGRAGGLLLAGAAGVGKTRLAREAAATARRRGVAVRWVSASATARRLPLGAFAPWLGGIEGDPAAVLRRARRALLAEVGRAALMVVVDDVHLLDDVSALLVQQLALRDSATLLLTVRAGEPVPDTVTALWKDGHVGRLELGPLPQPETDAPLAAALGGPVDSASAARIWALTRGNALFVQQLVEGEREAGRLRQVSEVWRWSGEPVLTAGLTELVRTRMGRLPDNLRDVVDVLAVGEPLGVPVLARLTGPDVVEEAEDRGLVVVDRDGRRLRATLAHPLYGEVRRADLGLLRARRPRGRVATALAQTGGRRVDDTLRRAVLAADSDLAADPDLLTSAAGSALGFAGLALGERLARAAVGAGGGFEARLALAFVLSFGNRGQEAEDELSVLDGLARDQLEQAQVAVTRAGNLHFILRRPDDAEAVLARAEAALAGGDERAPSVARSELAAIRAALLTFRGRSEEALGHATAALAGPAVCDRAVVLATWGLVGGHGKRGQADRARAAAPRGHAAAARDPGLAVLAQVLLHLQIDVLVGAGYLSEALDLARPQPPDRRPPKSGAGHQNCLVGVSGLA
ncbi:AAA family ATPase [Frankia sp. AgB1.9]|uniref:AAA family ATPase n=1 Tax=unclassified Frankia TaxID=2632575 RepID=UPI0019337540|nr:MULTISPECIES: AAA family ATPase [unclassified Frankia]MBL7487764.1 AAA family ATPase [Frankia sp. AgW1.1]MBL7547994.1 AAA family ATPase [Frankia sp. AgB1.9]MBL7622719.1 AAA family ATPase [Frankia sp. AgB1.8]